MSPVASISNSSPCCRRNSRPPFSHVTPWSAFAGTVNVQVDPSAVTLTVGFGSGSPEHPAPVGGVMVQHEPAGYEITQFGLDVNGCELDRATGCFVGFAGAGEDAFGVELLAKVPLVIPNLNRATAPPTTINASTATSSHGKTEERGFDVVGA